MALPCNRTPQSQKWVILFENQWADHSEGKNFSHAEHPLETLVTWLRELSLFSGRGVVCLWRQVTIFLFPPLSMRKKIQFLPSAFGGKNLVIPFGFLKKNVPKAQIFFCEKILPPLLWPTDKNWSPLWPPQTLGPISRYLEGPDPLVAAVLKNIGLN